MAGNVGGRNPSWLKMKKSALKSEKELKTSCEARHKKKKKSLVSGTSGKQPEAEITALG